MIYTPFSLRITWGFSTGTSFDDDNMMSITFSTSKLCFNIRDVISCSDIFTSPIIDFILSIQLFNFAFSISSSSESYNI